MPSKEALISDFPRPAQKKQQVGVEASESPSASQAKQKLGQNLRTHPELSGH